MVPENERIGLVAAAEIVVAAVVAHLTVLASAMRLPLVVVHHRW